MELNQIRFETYIYATNCLYIVGIPQGVIGNVRCEFGGGKGIGE